MAEREFQIVAKTQVDCDQHCKANGQVLFGEWCLQPYRLRVEANGQDTDQVVVWCKAPGAPKQADGKTPRVCVTLNEGTTIREV